MLNFNILPTKELIFTSWDKSKGIWESSIDKTVIHIQQRGKHLPAVISIINSDILPIINIYEKRYEFNDFGTLRPSTQPYLFFFNSSNNYYIKGTYFAQTNNLILRYYETNTN